MCPVFAAVLRGGHKSYEGWRILMIRRVLAPVCVLVASFLLNGCASPKLVPAQSHAPSDPASVMLYQQPPPKKYEVLGKVEITENLRWQDNGDVSPVVEEMKTKAAQLGANGLLLTVDPSTEPDARLCTCGGVRPAERRGVVDLMVPLTTLMRLNDDPGVIPGWGPVIADIARQVAHDQATNPTWKWSVTDEHGQLLHHGHTRRRPTATEEAFTRARDRTCRALGCRRRASRCDIDHRQPHPDGGPSHRGNQCCLCRHHHRLKHAKGFTVQPLGQGAFMWYAQDGRLYLVPADGNVVAIEAAKDNAGVWDLSNVKGPPRQVRQIIPR